MRLKNCKIVCIILAITFSLSGIYFDSTETGSPFTYTSTESTASGIELNHLISDAQACTSRMLGIKNTNDIKQLTERCFRQKRASQTSFACLYPYIFSLQEDNFLTSSEITFTYSRCTDELITSYIHNSDGKKRI